MAGNVYVERVLTDINEEAERKIEKRARELITSILNMQQQILSMTNHIAECKKELREMKAHEPVTLEL